MKRLLSLSLLALILALGGGMLAVAGQAPGGDTLIPREAVMRTFVRLNLTDAQKHEVATVLASHREEARSALERVRAAVAGFRQVSASPTADEAAVRRAFQALAAAGEEAVVIKNRIMAEVRTRLTPEQRQTLASSRDLVAEKVRERVEAARSVFEEWIDTHAKAAG